MKGGNIIIILLLQGTMLHSWLLKKLGNKHKLAKNIISETQRKGEHDIRNGYNKRLRLALAEKSIKDSMTPLKEVAEENKRRINVLSTLQGIISVIELREENPLPNTPIPERITYYYDLTVNDVSEDDLTKALRGKQYQVLSWKQRSAGIFMFLHPKVYGSGSFKHRVQKAADSIGVEVNTFQTWVSLCNKKSASKIPQWLSYVENMEWRTVKLQFTEEWYKQWDILGSDHVKDYLQPYRAHVMRCNRFFLIQQP